MVASCYRWDPCRRRASASGAPSSGRSSEKHLSVEYALYPRSGCSGVVQVYDR